MRRETLICVAHCNLYLKKKKLPNFYSMKKEIYKKKDNSVQLPVMKPVETFWFEYNFLLLGKD